MEEKALHPTLAGVPQGGIISASLLVLALKGMEETIKSVTSQKDKVHLVSYADDFIITGATKAVLEEKVKPAVVTFTRVNCLSSPLRKTSSLS
jgi:RNA-directed DNA polymerase